MSKAKQNGRKQPGGKRNAVLYAITAVCIILAGIVLVSRRAQASVHPSPRSAAAEMMTKNPNDFADADTREVYTMAAEIKSTLDGLFCYCYCKGGGHYSLLDCFKDDHGAGCDICKGEARLAYRMVKQGASLEQIRAAIDAQFGTQS